MSIDQMYNFLLDRKEKVETAKLLAKDVTEKHNRTQAEVEDGALRVTIEEAVVEDIQGQGDKRGKFLLLASQVSLNNSILDSKLVIFLISVALFAKRRGRQGLPDRTFRHAYSPKNLFRGLQRSKEAFRLCQSR